MGGLPALWPLGGGAFLGWTLGANDAANVFGTAVGARIVRWRTAALLCAVFVVLGAVLQGGEGIRTLSGITHQSLSTAVIVSVASALTVALMIYLKIPVSTSQCVVGAILGIGLATRDTEYGGLIKVVLCWIGTPIGSMIFSIVSYEGLAFLLRRFPLGLLTRDRWIWIGLLLSGCYGAYALGANNVANTTGMFSGLLHGVSDDHLTLVGGLAIAAGTLTFSKRVMLNVGTGIMRLDAFTALAAVLGMSITVHVFAIAGAPVSTSQGIVGSILGIGLMRGAQGVHFDVLGNIAVGWVLSPAISLVLSAAGYAIFL
jgi:PiT family inorganic phosphate transporter